MKNENTVYVTVRMLLSSVERPALPSLDIQMAMRGLETTAPTEVSRLYVYPRGWDSALREFRNLPAELASTDRRVRQVNVSLSARGRDEVTFEFVGEDTGHDERRAGAGATQEAAGALSRTVSSIP